MPRGNRSWGNTSKSRYYLTMGVVFFVLGIFFSFFCLWMDEQRRQQLSQLPYASRYGATSFLGPTMLLFVGCWIGFAALFLILGLHYRRRERRVTEKMRGLTGGGVPADDFLSNRGALRQSDFTGVYVLHNVTKDMYYVGQSVRVVDRVTQHLTGHGNGDVYADFKYGDVFEVSTVSLAESGYGSLNDLERDAIAAYDAYNHGYNRTAGNAR